ncbi:MAG: hypothetical protein AAGI91_06535 [Bacteroidota bacterium]
MVPRAPAPRNAARPVPVGEASPDQAPFVSGVIRGAGTRRAGGLTVRPCLLHGPDLSAPPASPESAPEAPDLAALREAWEAEWTQQAEAERDAHAAAVREEAYAAGFAAARDACRAEREAEREAFARDAASLHGLWQAHLERADPLLVGLAVEVAEAVLGRPPDEASHGAMTAAVTAAVERLADRPPLVVALHPVDQLRLQETGMAEALTAAHPGLRWVPDAGLAEGDWTLDADGEAVRHVRAEVLSDLRRRLGLAPDPPPDSAP